MQVEFTGPDNPTLIVSMGKNDDLTEEEKKKKFEEMIENPTAHQLKSYYDAKEKACIDAMKDSTSKNPHNKGSNLAEFWEYVYKQFYKIQ